jgi:hypothetical protein
VTAVTDQEAIVIDKANALIRVHNCAILSGVSAMQLNAAVLSSRRLGATWKEVAASLGVSRQAATSRFKHLEQTIDEEVG